MKKRTSGLARVYAILIALADEPDEEQKNTAASMDSQASDATVKQNDFDQDRSSKK